MNKSKQQKAAELAMMKAMFYGRMGAYYTHAKPKQEKQ